MPAEPVKPAVASSRYFVRCTGCLSVSAIDVAKNQPIYTVLGMEYGRLKAKCGICDSSLELMGRVQLNRLVTDHTRCACNELCVAARGPLCTCKCGGKNHGAGMLAVVHYTQDAGSIPTITPKSGAAKAKAQYLEFSTAYADLKARLGRLLDRRQAGEFLPRGDFDQLLTLRRLNHELVEARTHASRMKKLTAALR